MGRALKTVCLCVPLSAFFVSSTQATVVVYTDRVAWETAVLAVPTGHFHDQNFDGSLPGGLSTGLNDFLPLTINIPGTPGLNAIDDSFTADPFSDGLSPNGSTYYLGDVGVSASIAPILSFFDYPGFAVIGFGADWVIQGELVVEVQGTLIPFSTHLPTDSGFLGVITDQGEETLVANLTGSAAFGMDELRTGNIVPAPSAVCLFNSGLFGLIGIARRRAARL
jgi:hypothetical protein